MAGGQGVAGSNPVSPARVFTRQRPASQLGEPASTVVGGGVGTILGTIPLEHLN